MGSIDGGEIREALFIYVSTLSSSFIWVKQILIIMYKCLDITIMSRVCA